MNENSTHQLTESYEYKDYNREIEPFWRFILCFPAFAFNMDFLRHPTIASVSKQQHRNYDWQDEAANLSYGHQVLTSLVKRSSVHHRSSVGF